MPDKKIKRKDMVIAILCTLLAILCIVFYFLPAFDVKHKADPSADFEVVTFSGWDMTKSVFTDTIVLGTKIEKLLAIKNDYGFAIILSGILLPLSILCSISTAVFAYLAWLKNEDFKKYCFLFSLVGMVFGTLTLISTWFIAIQIRNGNNFQVFGANLKGSISYASFVNLILSFVVAIIACAYNYFLDNFDEEEEEEEDDDEEYEIIKVKKKKIVEVEDDEIEEDKPKKKVSLESNEKKKKTDQVKFDNKKKNTNK